MIKERILLIVILGSLVSLIGTMLGASLGVMVKKPSKRLLGVAIGFAGGLMMSIVVFDLLPEAIKEWSLTWTLVFCLLGIATAITLDKIFSVSNKYKNSHIKVAIMTALGLMLHNLPEGIIMGCGFLTGGTLGFKMSLIIAIHDIPEGIAVAAPLMASNVKVTKILLYALITALPTAIGTWFGAYISSVSSNVLGGCLAFASGIMLYVVCGGMFPESSKLWDGLTSSIGILSGIMLGLVMTNLL